MEQKQSLQKTNMVFLVISILAVSSLQLSCNSISTVLPMISDEFPQVREGIIQSIVSIPPFVGVAVQLVVGGLSIRFGKKNLLIVGLVTIFLGGLLPIAITGSIGVLIASSVILGVGLGMVAPLAIGLIMDCFHESKQDMMLGAQNAGLNVGGMIYPLLGGFFALQGYQYSYLVFLVCLPILICVCLGVPKKPVYQEVVHKEKISFKIPFVAIAICAAAFFFIVFQFTCITNIAQFLEDKGLGDSSTAGMVLSFASVGGVGGALLYMFFAKHMGNRALEVAIFITAIGYGLITFSGAMTGIMIGGAFTGAGVPLLMSWSSKTIAGTAEPQYSTYLIAVFMSVFSLAQSFSPVVMITLSKVVSDGSTTSRFAISFVALLVLLVMIILIKWIYKKRPVRFVS